MSDSQHIEFDENDSLDKSNIGLVAANPVVSSSLSNSDNTNSNKIDFDENDSLDKNKYSEWDSFQKGTEQGLLLGFADEAKGTLEQGFSTAQDLFHKLGIADLPSPYTYDKEHGIADEDPYLAARDEARVDYNGAQAANPKMNFAGNIAGSLLTTPFMPAKALAPLGNSGKIGSILAKNSPEAIAAAEAAGKAIPLALDAAAIGKNLGIATKVAANSIPLSVATGVGMSEGKDVGEVANDAVQAAKFGAVASPLLHGVIPPLAEGASKVKEAAGDILNTIPGEPLNRFKLGWNGVLAASTKTKKKIEEIITSQVTKFKDAVGEASAQKVLLQDLDLHNIENQIGQTESQIAKLTDDYNNLSTQQTSYKRDAILTKSDEKAGIISDEGTRLKDQIKELENQKESLLNDYELRTHEAIKKHEAQLADANAKHKELKQQIDYHKEILPKLHADEGQALLQQDLDQTKQNYDMLDDDLRTRDIKFNVSQDIKDFEGTLGKLANGDEELETLNKGIVDSLKNYKGSIDKDKLITLINGFKDKYGKQFDSGLRVLRNKVKDPGLRRTYDKAFDSLEDSVRKTQDFQLRDFGHEDLANQYQQNNQAYKAIKNLQGKYLDKDYSAGLVSEIADLGKIGVIGDGANKGAKGVYNDSLKNKDILPNFGQFTDRTLAPYIKSGTEQLPKQSLAVNNEIANLEDMLSQLKSNKKVPSKFATSTEDKNILNQVNDLDSSIAATKDMQSKGQFSPEKQDQINKLEQQLDILKNDSNADPTYGKMTDDLKANELNRKKLLGSIDDFKQKKSDLIKPQEKTTQLDKMIATEPVDREDALRKLIVAADRERTLGGAGSSIQKLDELQAQLKLDSSTLDPERKKLQDMLAAYKDDIDFALSSSGKAAGSFGDFVGAGSNITGYAAGKIASPLTAANKGLKLLGKQNMIPTTSGMQSIDDILAKISNKPIGQITQMDGAGQAALKNGLLQISPAIRQHLENLQKEDKGN